MRRRSATHPEVAGGSHKTSTKVMLPNPVHDHPRGQWIRRGRQPARQFDSPTTCLGSRQSLSPKHAEESARDFSPFHPRVSTLLHLRIGWLSLADSKGEIDVGWVLDQFVAFLRNLF